MTEGTASSRLHDSATLGNAVAYRIHRSNRMLLTHLHRFLASQPTPLSPEKWFILAQLHQNDGLRQVDLTEGSLSDAPNVSRLVDALVALGLVERTADPNDRRSKLLRLTAVGRSATNDVLEAVIHERSVVFAGLDDNELLTLTETLDKIDTNVRRLLTNTTDR